MKIRTDGMDEQDGTDGPSGKCQLLQMIVIKSDDYLAKLHCNSEGQISTEVKRLTLKGNRLVTSVVGEKNETTQADHANDPPPSVDKRCVVVDPTGTQLNVRTSPNGRIVGTIANGVTVPILDNSVDNRRKSWVYIGEYNSGKPVGWVFREFISCL